jgi:hypothetical protein
MALRGRGWIVVLSIVTASCGDDDDDGPSGAVLDCQRFATAWCARSMDCLVEVGTLTAADRQANYDVCYDVAVAAAQCERAVTVGASYDTCMTQVETMDCQMFAGPAESLSPTPPAACEGVIGVQ